MTALVGSGLPAGRFVFEGFLPRKGSGRSERLAELALERRTVVLYEAPHRLERTLTDLIGVCGSDRRVTFGRELTKLHEEFWRGTLADALEALTGQRQMDASAILDYFAPLQAWLKEQNKGQQCGW